MKPRIETITKALCLEHSARRHSECNAELLLNGKRTILLLLLPKQETKVTMTKYLIFCTEFKINCYWEGAIFRISNGFFELEVYISSPQACSNDSKIHSIISKLSIIYPAWVWGDSKDWATCK